MVCALIVLFSLEGSFFPLEINGLIPDDESPKSVTDHLNEHMQLRCRSAMW
jgi:hypothetical protein